MSLKTKGLWIQSQGKNRRPDKHPFLPSSFLVSARMWLFAMLPLAGGIRMKVRPRRRASSLHTSLQDANSFQPHEPTQLPGSSTRYPDIQKCKLRFSFLSASSSPSSRGAYSTRIRPTELIVAWAKSLDGRYALSAATTVALMTTSSALKPLRTILQMRSKCWRLSA